MKAGNRQTLEEIRTSSRPVRPWMMACQIAANQPLANVRSSPRAAPFLIMACPALSGMNFEFSVPAEARQGAEGRRSEARQACCHEAIRSRTFAGLIRLRFRGERTPEQAGMATISAYTAGSRLDFGRGSLKPRSRTVPPLRLEGRCGMSRHRQGMLPLQLVQGVGDLAPR